MTSPYGDDRVSDAATGLPPLEELHDDETMLVLAWASGDGLASNAFTDTDEPCRFLHLRGLVMGESGPEWGQIHVAVPVAHAVDVAVALAGGSLGRERTADQ